jgi:hypothetical protein
MSVMECYLEFQGLYKNFHDEHLMQLKMELMTAGKKNTINNYFMILDYLSIL